MMHDRIRIGLESFLESPPKALFGYRWGLLCNPASVNHQFAHAREWIDRKFPEHLKALYSPQHGFFAEKQDNMIESGNLMDPVLNIPIFSLYSDTRMPSREMFDLIDVLLVDLQDVGTRVYTFIYTLSYCMEAAKSYGKRVVVLDRPNPIGGISVEGNCLSPDCASFVGRYPIPMRHGMTIGELALMFNQHFGIGCDLEIVEMNGWRRDMLFARTDLPWVAPSPNMPTPATARVYPGQVIWEGTNVSEGRGTTQPFEIFGAPFMDTKKIISFLGGNSFPGVVLRQTLFEPAFNKWKGMTCNGFQLHVTDPYVFCPYRMSLTLLRAILAIHSEAFSWKLPPYEYEFTRHPIDLILGDKRIRHRIEEQYPIERIEDSWQEDLEAFDRIRRGYLLYG